MTSNHPDTAWLGVEFFENQQKFPPAELMKYAGLHVAWSWDGTRVVASAPTEEDLYAKLEAEAIDPQRVVFAYVDPLDQVNLG